MSSAEQMYDEAVELKEAGKLEAAVGKLEELVERHPDYALGYAGLSVYCGISTAMQIGSSISWQIRQAAPTFSRPGDRPSPRRSRAAIPHRRALTSMACARISER